MITFDLKKSFTLRISRRPKIYLYLEWMYKYGKKNNTTCNGYKNEYKCAITLLQTLFRPKLLHKN